ncbi:hypothetical protein JTE90_014278 [Oedothorax gibbosus]|uniref:Uncharacterized protein n=1 Tax=Oedothorax gibbosus TaxID=931172 RepID=A0AAV6TJD3_9ARAC|nr:hypothetical protein JTE90_014278 [Oedothorax gibbosus]
MRQKPSAAEAEVARFLLEENFFETGAQGTRKKPPSSCSNMAIHQTHLQETKTPQPCCGVPPQPPAAFLPAPRSPGPTRNLGASPARHAPPQ